MHAHSSFSGLLNSYITQGVNFIYSGIVILRSSLQQNNDDILQNTTYFQNGCSHLIKRVIFQIKNFEFQCQQMPYSQLEEQERTLTTSCALTASAEGGCILSESSRGPDEGPSSLLHSNSAAKHKTRHTHRNRCTRRGQKVNRFTDNWNISPISRVN